MKNYGWGKWKKTIDELVDELFEAEMKWLGVLIVQCRYDLMDQKTSDRWEEDFHHYCFKLQFYHVSKATDHETGLEDAIRYVMGQYWALCFRLNI